MAAAVELRGREGEREDCGDPGREASLAAGGHKPPQGRETLRFAAFRLQMFILTFCGKHLISNVMLLDPKVTIFYSDDGSQ